MEPSAYSAKWWLSVADAATSLASGKPREEWSTHVGAMLGLPYAYATDWLKTAGSLWGSLFLGGRRE